MAKRNDLKVMTLEELKGYEEQIQYEIENLQKIIEASDTVIFGALIKEVKDEMIAYIKAEEWKLLKSSQKKVEAYRTIEKDIENSEELLHRKEEELNDVREAIKYNQLSFLDKNKKKSKGGK